MTTFVNLDRNQAPDFIWLYLDIKCTLELKDIGAQGGVVCNVHYMLKAGETLDDLKSLTICYRYLAKTVSSHENQSECPNKKI